MPTQIQPRIILYLNAFPKLSETFIVNKFLGLLKKGWDVHIVCSESTAHERRSFPELNKIPSIGQRIHVNWRHRPRWLAASLIPIALLRCLVFAPKTTLQYLSDGFKIFGVDVFRRLYMDAEAIILQPSLIHFEFGTLAAERIYLKRLLRCKTIVSFRGYDLNFSGLDIPTYYADVWSKVDAVHVLGQDLWKRALRRGCPADKMHVVIPPALDAQKFPSPTRRRGDKNDLEILSVGRLEWKKGYEYSLQSIQLLRDAGINCHLHIIGGGSYLEALTFAQQQFNLANNVKFLGSLTHAETIMHMRQADLFLHAAVSEGFCNAVQEAQILELPVVCTDADGLSENIKNGETGFVVPRRNPEALAEKIALLAHNPALRKKMGLSGRRHVEENFQISKQISQFESIYNALLNNKRI